MRGCRTRTPNIHRLLLEMQPQPRLCVKYGGAGSDALVLCALFCTKMEGTHAVSTSKTEQMTKLGKNSG